MYKIQTTGDEERQHMETRMQRLETIIERLVEQVVQDSIKIVSENQNAVVEIGRAHV